jgi:hypothetical protein
MIIPAMVTITPSLRKTTYDPVVSTTTFAVNFPLFANADLLVVINDVPRTDYTVTATYVDGVSTNAAVIMNSGVIGNVVIYGMRAPARTDQFNNGAPLPISNFNYALNRLEIENQEARRDIGELRDDLNTEITDRETGDAALAVALSAETSARIAADSTEQSQRIAGDNALRALIAATHSVSTAYFDTLGGAKLAVIPPSYRSIVTAGYDQAGDGGLEVWSWVASEPPHDMKWQSADGAWWQPASSTVRAESIGAKLDGVTNCSPAINAALSYVGYRGGGTVLLGQGTALLRNTNPGAGSWANFRAIYIGHNHVRIRGAGGTILKLADGESADVIQVGQRVETIVLVDDVIISDIEIDGNRDNVPLPDDDTNHWSGITVSSNCSRVHIHDMYIHDCQYYAIGMQRDALINCSIRRVKCYNTGADAIDWKDDTATGHGNVADEIDIENFGLATGLLTGQAGLDLRSGVTASNIHVKGMGPMATVGIRMQVGVAGEVPYQVSTLKDFKVTGTNIANTQGVRVITRYAQVVLGKVQGIGGDGYSITAPDVRISNCVAEANAVGYRLWQDASAGFEADTNTYVGLESRSNVQAGIIVDSVDEVSFIGCDVRSNTGIGYDIRTGSTAIRIIGGSCTGNGTNVNDVDGIATISNVSGLRTEQHLVLSASIDVSTTGRKTFTFNHNLAFTPSVADVNLNLVRGTLDGNLQISGLMVSAVSSSQIIGEFRVVVAAGAGITMQVACFARVKTG